VQQGVLDSNDDIELKESWSGLNLGVRIADFSWSTPGT
jgi:hypothetical protein